MSQYCNDCGCKVYNGHCVNCHEETYIERQYVELGEPVPESISKKAIEQTYNPQLPKIINPHEQ